MFNCSLCGHSDFAQHKVLWPELISEWQLSPGEVDYVERQQGLRCNSCGSNLRGIALGFAIAEVLKTDLPLLEFAKSPAAQKLRILDMNGTSVSSAFSSLAHYTRAAYPQIDMQSMPYQNGEFDLVVHSDTLEHIPNPIHALKECRRVLRQEGSLCYTVPIIVGRMSRDRTGLPPSYHGKAIDKRADYLVETEFGADAWTYPLQAGFRTVKFNTLLYPSALAITAA